MEFFSLFFSSNPEPFACNYLYLNNNTRNWDPDMNKFVFGSGTAYKFKVAPDIGIRYIAGYPVSIARYPAFLVSDLICRISENLINFYFEISVFKPLSGLTGYLAKYWPDIRPIWCNPTNYGSEIQNWKPTDCVIRQENLIYELSVICLDANAKHISAQVKSLRLSQFKYTSFYKFLWFFLCFFVKIIIF